MFNPVVDAWRPSWLHVGSERKLNITFLQSEFIEFLRRGDGQVNVALDDIGAPAFYSGGVITDLFGLANHFWALKRMTAPIIAGDLDDYCNGRQVVLVMIYEGNWGSIPNTWKRLMAVNFPVAYNKPRLLVFSTASAGERTESFRVLAAKFARSQRQIRPEVKIDCNG
jgi:hypothetical protein